MNIIELKVHTQYNYAYYPVISIQTFSPDHFEMQQYKAKLYRSSESQN